MAPAADWHLFVMCFFPSQISTFSFLAAVAATLIIVRALEGSIFYYPKLGSQSGIGALERVLLPIRSTDLICRRRNALIGH